MSDTCSLCHKPIEGDVLVARHEGWEKNWHPVCFAKMAVAEIAILQARAATAELNAEEARSRARYYLRALEEGFQADEQFVALERHLYPWLEK